MDKEQTYQGPWLGNNARRTDAHPAVQVLDASIPVQYTILVNQTATHAIPAALNAANTALLRAATGRADANISVVNYPLPTLTHEAAIQVSQAAGGCSPNSSGRQLQISDAVI